MNSHAFRCTVIDRGKDGNRSVRLSARGGGIGAPHLIGSLGHDLSFMRVTPNWLRLTRWREQRMGPQQPQNPIFRSPDPRMTQASPDLAISFAGEYGRIQKPANLRDQLLIGSNPRASLARFPPLLPLAAGGVKTGTRQAPDSYHPRHTIRLVAGRRDGVAHGLDLQGAKGRPFSRRAIFSRNNSFSTLMLATTDFKRRFSSSSASISRLIRPSSPLAMKRSSP